LRNISIKLRFARSIFQHYCDFKPVTVAIAHTPTTRPKKSTHFATWKVEFRVDGSIQKSAYPAYKSE